MKKAISLIILALAANLFTCAGETFRIGNSLVERSLSWDGSVLVDNGVRNVANGSVFASGWKVNASDVSFDRVDVPGDTLRQGYVKYILSFVSDGLQVRREYRVYENVAAIACDNYFRGDASSFRKKYVMERVQLPSMHYRLRCVEFFDATDNHDNLVRETEALPFYKNNYRGNLLFASPTGGGDGIWMLKEAPTSRSQLAYPGVDYNSDASAIQMLGVGLEAEDINAETWTKGYSSVVGLYDGTFLDASVSLRRYQKSLRRHVPERDEMVMMNTWGDRNRDARVGERFCIEEVEKAHRLGISHFQIDDGWQSGKSPNSAFAGGSFKNIWDNPDYWTPDPAKYPNGLGPVVKAADDLGVTLGLWYNPSIKNNFSDWEKDAAAIIGLWKNYGIKVYKIDGVELPSKEAEVNFRRILDTVLEATGGDVVFNLDVTAGRRGGYFMFNEYGNLFLENRYSDWGNYYPYRTLRNLWMLSRYVPAENIQLEFLNNWRNHDKYSGSDDLAPAAYSFEYLFSLTMAGQPLAWMEASNLPEEGFEISSLIRAYRTLSSDFHSGFIMPVGNEPCGRTWTGFQSICGERNGYLLVYREKCDDRIAFDTFLPAGVKVKLEPVLGYGKKTAVKVDAPLSRDNGSTGSITISLPTENTFCLYRYSF